MTTFTIPGDPHAQKRHRSRIAGKGERQFVQTYDAPESRSWKGSAQVHMLEAMSGRSPMTGLVRLTIRAFWSLPKSHERKRAPRSAVKYASTKDADNVAKAVMDAGNGVLWVDDRQVVELLVEKWRAAQGDPGRVEVEVEEVFDG